MNARRVAKSFAVILIVYLLICVAIGIFMTDAALHPARRPLDATDEALTKSRIEALGATIGDIEIHAKDGAALRAWTIRPSHPNGNAVILLHGMGDNRLGMTSYAELLLRHGYSVLTPDARAQGSSEGSVATYGLLERDDIRDWTEWLSANSQPLCIFGLGESMGAAQLLQSLAVDSNFCAVVAESAFSSFREIAYDRVGQFFKTGPWIGRSLLRPAIEVGFVYARLRYGINFQGASPEDCIRMSKVPILLIHGQIDSNIPLRHSLQIQRQNPRVFLWKVPNADHCGAIGTHPEEFERGVSEWFTSHSN